MNTAPKALTRAAVVDPGTKKFTSVIVLPSGVKSFWALNVVKIVGKLGSRLPNLTGVLVELTALALTSNPLPGVLKTTPRGEFTLKKVAGKLLGAENASGTPSQLISRRPLPNEPATFGLSVPRVVRNASTVDWMAVASAPEAERTTAAARAVWALSKAVATSDARTIRRAGGEWGRIVAS